MGRVGNFFKKAWRGIKNGFRRGRHIVNEADKAITKGREAINKYHDKVDTGKEILRKHGGKIGAKIADGADKVEAGYNKATNAYDKGKSKVQQVVTSIKGR